MVSTLTLWLRSRNPSIKSSNSATKLYLLQKSGLAPLQVPAKQATKHVCVVQIKIYRVGGLYFLVLLLLLLSFTLLCVSADTRYICIAHAASFVRSTYK